MQCIRDSDELFAFLQKGCGNSESNHNKIKKKQKGSMAGLGECSFTAYVRI